MSFTVQINGDRELISKLVTMPNTVRAALLTKIHELALRLENKVKVEHLSGPTGPSSLSVQTGALRRSVHNQVESTDSSVTGAVYYAPDVPYAGIHEFGGTINVPEIVPINAMALHFYTKGGDEVFARRAAAHTVHIPERAPLRTAFAEMKAEILEGMRSAVMQGLLRGR